MNFTTCKKSHITDIIKDIGGYMQDCQDIPLTISPIFSATARITFAKELQLSNYRHTAIFLVRLEEQQARDIVYTTVAQPEAPATNNNGTNDAKK